MFDERLGNYAVKFIQSLKHTKGQFAGQPFILLPWERNIIWDVYGTVNARGTRQYKYVWVEISKKNGKSELGAAVGLKQTFADGEINGEVYGGAAEREQASIIFDVAVDMVDMTPELKKRTKLNLSKKMMTDKVTGTIYRVLSSEAYSKHGYNLSAFLGDEIHAWQGRGLWDVMTFGSGSARRQPIYFNFTTAGDDPDRVTIGWELHEKALAIINGDIVDPTWYPVVYNYDGDDIYNEDNWYKANPSLGHTIDIETVREEALSARYSPANERLFRWLRLNQWTTTKLTTWLPLELFEATEGTWTRADLLGEDCFIGQDLSSTTDLTALVLVFPPQRNHRDWRVIFDVFIPENNMRERIVTDHVDYDKWLEQGYVTATEGDVIDYTAVEWRIQAYRKLYNVQELCTDRTFAAMLVQRLEQTNLVCVDVPQQYGTLTDPMNEIETKLKNGEMTHEAHPCARWCFGNTSIAKNGNGQIKYVKERRGRNLVRTKRIDTTAAWVIAMVRARFYRGVVDLSAAILNEEWGV
jgi:phage terminase large subunit-like protein